MTAGTKLGFVRTPSPQGHGRWDVLNPILQEETEASEVK